MASSLLLRGSSEARLRSKRGRKCGVHSNRIFANELLSSFLSPTCKILDMACEPRIIDLKLLTWILALDCRLRLIGEPLKYFILQMDINQNQSMHRKICFQLQTLLNTTKSPRAASRRLLCVSAVCSHLPILRVFLDEAILKALSDLAPPIGRMAIAQKVIKQIRLHLPETELDLPISVNLTIDNVA